VLLSWVTLGEVPTALGLLGGALCLTGVAVSRRTPTPHVPTEVAAAATSQ
jgi:drug/metabolite transporter (DMT)-like permease